MTMTASARRVQDDDRLRKYHLLRIGGSVVAILSLLVTAGPKLW